MPAIPQTWLDSQTVNTTLTGSQTQSNIAQLANGNILVTWTTTDQTGLGSPPGTEVFAQIFDPMGEKIGTEFIINNVSVTDNERDSDIVALPSGGFIVVYHDFDIDNLGGSNIRLEEFDATGAPVSESSSVVGDASNAGFPNYANPRGAASSSTSVLVVYDKISSATTSDIYGRVYDPTTNIYGAEFVLISGDETTNADIAVLSNGNYVIAAATDATDAFISYRIVTAAGVSVLAATIAVGTDTNSEFERSATVTALTGGGFVIAWVNLAGADTDVNFKVFDNLGAETGSGTITSDNTINDDFNEPVVTGLADGSFLIAYDDIAAGDGVVAHYSAAGVFLGQFAFDGLVSSFAITSLADGRFAVTYLNGEVQMQILDTRDAVNTQAGYTPQDWQIGTINDDVFTVSGAAVFVRGHTGNDTITEGVGNTSIFGDAGDDRIIVTSSIAGDDFFGGAGNDTIDWSAVVDTDVVFDLALGTATDNGVLIEDVVGFEHLIGTASNDTILGTTGNNNLIGGNGNDSINGGLGSDTMFGGSGNDNLTGGDGTDTLSGGSGVDILIGGTGIDLLIGGTNGDTYIVDNPSDQIIEAVGQGGDRVLASANYTLAAGAEVEVMQTISVGSVTAINLIGNTFAQKLFGNAGANLLDGGSGAADTLTGFGGNDSYIVRNAASVIVEGVGQGTADRVLAGTSFVLAADDNIEVMQTVSTLAATAINLTGNALGQSFFGNAGVNQIDGREGQDTMTGGSGADRFVFATAIATTNVDIITDFVAGLDEILLEGGFFTGIGNGGLGAFRFHAGASGQATTADVRIIYETDNGNLWYDADGNGAGVRVLFGDLAAGLGVTFNDFTVF